MWTDLKNETLKMISEFVDVSHLSAGSVLVVGCSSSEIVGCDMGKNSNMEAAEVVFETIYDYLQKKKIFLAVQCCEHLNRAVVVEKEVADNKNLEVVNVVPQPHAGGAFATHAYVRFCQPVVVENIKADAGIDIGGVLIGMQLKAVAVPVKLQVKHLGAAMIICARTRPKYIGGVRACYDDDLC